MIRFVAINDYGNRFFMDNVKINGLNILSINELQEINNVEVFPNPSKGTFRVKSNHKNIEFEIYTTMGKLIERGIINKPNKTIILSNQKKGIYFIQFKIENKIIQQKLIIQ